MKLKNLVCIIFVISCFAIFSSAVFAYTQAEYVDVIQDASNRLVNLQGTDGGWDWLPDPSATSHTASASSSNTVGVTAEGVLQAYTLTGYSSYLTSATDAYKLIDLNANSSDPYTSRIRGSDITFLVEMSKLTFDPKYASRARERYLNATATYGGNATAFAEYIKANRCNLGGIIEWDIDLYVQGALALDSYYPGEGFDTDATKMAEVIYGDLTSGTPCFDETNSSSVYYIIGLSGSIDALKSTNIHPTTVNDLTIKLLAAQNSDGSFVSADSQGAPVKIDYYQQTAYAAMALLKVGKIIEAQKATSSLVLNQSLNGGWVGPLADAPFRECTEVDSEAIQAIAALVKIGEATKNPEVVSVTLSDSDPVKAGTLIITVDFDKSMNTLMFPNTTINGPAVLTVKPDATYPNGWLDDDTWIGKIIINSSTKEGKYRLYVKNAKDVFGNKMITYSETRFSIDSHSPVFLKTFAPNIIVGETETLSASVYDPDSSGISHVTVKIDSGAEQNMTFSYSSKEKVDSKKVFVDTYFKNIASLGVGNHPVEFKVYDNAGNAAQVNTQFDVLSNAKSYGGNVAYLCLNDDCNFGIEASAIDFLETSGWIVTGKAYNKWTAAELQNYNLIVCSEQSKACSLTSALNQAHVLNTKPLVELSSTPSALAGKSLNYLKTKVAGTSKYTTDIFVTTPDSITAGYSGSTTILTSTQKIPVIRDNYLKTGTIDLATTSDRIDYSNLFKVDGTPSHGRYVGILWFNSRTVSDHLRGYDLDTPYPGLTLAGKTILKRAISWAQCGSPLGCLSS